MKVQVSNWLSEVGGTTGQFVVYLKDENNFIVKSQVVDTHELALNLKKEWEKQLIII